MAKNIILNKVTAIKNSTDLFKNYYNWYHFVDLDKLILYVTFSKTTSHSANNGTSRFYSVIYQMESKKHLTRNIFYINSLSLLKKYIFRIRIFTYLLVIENCLFYLLLVTSISNANYSIYK